MEIIYSQKWFTNLKNKCSEMMLMSDRWHFQMWSLSPDVFLVYWIDVRCSFVPIIIVDSCISPREPNPPTHLIIVLVPWCIYSVGVILPKVDVETC